MSMANFQGFAREFNSESEQLAADRRARVAAAVSQQEWLDKEEIKWIPTKYRSAIKHGDAEEIEEVEEPVRQEDLERGLDSKNMDYLLGPEPADDPEEEKKKAMKKYGWLYALLAFVALFLGSVYFFWDQMHAHIDPHRPAEMTQVEGVGMETAPTMASAEY